MFYSLKTSCFKKDCGTSVSGLGYKGLENHKSSQQQKKLNKEKRNKSSQILRHQDTGQSDAPQIGETDRQVREPQLTRAGISVGTGVGKPEL